MIIAATDAAAQRALAVKDGAYDVRFRMIPNKKKAEDKKRIKIILPI